MARLAAFAVLAGAVLVAGTASAQSTPPESDARFSFHKVGDGFLRLHGRTGQVSLCLHRTAGWTCETVPDERAALESEIARLQNSNAALKKDLLARGLPLPEPARPEPPGATTRPPELKLPSQADIDRVMSFVEKVWRRLIEMMGQVQKDMFGKT